MNSIVPPPAYMALWRQAKPLLRVRVLPLLDQGVVPGTILVIIYGGPDVIVLQPDAARTFLRPYDPLRAIVESLDRNVWR